MNRTKAVVITGYQEKEAQFGVDVSRYYTRRRLGGNRGLSFYAVGGNEGAQAVETAAADREIREYLEMAGQADLLIDVHMDPAESICSASARDRRVWDCIDALCANVPGEVVCRLSQAIGVEHVMSDVVFPWEEDRPEDATDTDQFPTLAETGIPTVTAQTYVPAASLRSKGRTYKRQVSQMARSINTIYDAFDAHVR